MLKTWFKHLLSLHVHYYYKSAPTIVTNNKKKIGGERMRKASKERRQAENEMDETGQQIIQQVGNQEDGISES